MQTLCLSQGAVLGVLVGMAFSQLSVDSHEIEHNIFPFFSGVTVAVLTFLFSLKITGKTDVSKGALFLSVYIVLMAFGHIVTAVVPTLESHMSHIFFGDLATLGEIESQIGIVIALFSSIYLISNWRVICDDTFELATFGNTLKGKDRRKNATFYLVSLMLISFSVQFLGFLYTIGALFVPTVVLGVGATAGVRLHLILGGTVVFVGSLSGFVGSLSYSRLPTVPMIIASILILALATSLFLRVSERR